MAKRGRKPTIKKQEDMPIVNDDNRIEFKNKEAKKMGLMERRAQGLIFDRVIRFGGGL